jgi:tripartite-type tricarboxylate transporter receptor subunit TctC
MGAQQVLRASADGYTLEVGGSITHAINGALYKTLAFDPMNDFVPVAMLANVVNVIGVSSKLPVKTFKDFLAYAAANPGKVNYSSGGIGSHNHLGMVTLARATHLDLVHVPYKGGGPAVFALAQGEVEVFHGGASLLAPQATSGKVRLIAVTEIVAYHGVPILDAEGALFGSLCHFDVVEQPLSDDEFGDLQAFARALAQYVIGREPSGLPL